MSEEITLRKEVMWHSPQNPHDYPRMPSLTIASGEIYVHGKLLSERDLNDLYIMHGYTRQVRWISAWEPV